MTAVTARRASFVCVTFAIIAITFLFWLRFHAKPLMVNLGGATCFTTPAIGVNIVTWDRPAPGVEALFNAQGSQVHVRFTAAGSARVTSESLPQGAKVHLLPVGVTQVATVMTAAGATTFRTAFVPLWWLPLVPLALAWRFARVAKRLALAKICPRCGYSLAGLAESVACPECGTNPLAS
ncbi:MAG TPA: hypothetical protein VK157_02535 [Phycisphaerales bacterium]|nr:hypothetical protein [Phycisphaerales bacterium]